MQFKELGHRIQTAREEKRMSQEQLAGAIGCSQSALSNYEKGKRRIYLSQLEKLSEVLEKPLDYFVEGFTENRPVMVAAKDNHILKIINELYLLSELEISQIDDYIQYLKWKKFKGEDGNGFFSK
jgi:transcriptional regulator with XRE-family HTH domain